MLSHSATQLQHFYNHQATKFSHTRKRPRPEFDHILSQIVTFPQSKLWPLRILELGCGDGRLYGRLHSQGIAMEYTGVDISKWLIDIAVSQYPDAQWMVAEMSDFLIASPSQHRDIVIMVASFHHLEEKERNLTAHEMYRVLCYEGVRMMTNRSFSQRFISKYWKSILDSVVEWLFKFGTHDVRDLSIPRRSQDRTLHFFRLYHIFSRRSLTQLLQSVGFVVEQMCYVDQSGWLSPHRWKSRNLRTVVRKSLTLDD